MEMEWYWALCLLLGGAVFLLILGMPVAFAFFTANIVGVFLFLRGDIGLCLTVDRTVLAGFQFDRVAPFSGSIRREVNPPLGPRFSRSVRGIAVGYEHAAP